MALQLTPSQTVGPFFSIGLTWEDGAFVVPEGTPGAFWIRGRVFDGEGEPVPDAMIETWQADPDGRYNHPDDPRGAEAATSAASPARPTDAEGRFGDPHRQARPVPGPDGATQAPHLEVSVFARGLLNRVVTRIYFADEARAQRGRPGARRACPEDRRATLLAEPEPRTATASTSASRGRARPSSSPSERRRAAAGLFDGVLARGARAGGGLRRARGCRPCSTPRRRSPARRRAPA